MSHVHFCCASYIFCVVLSFDWHVGGKRGWRYTEITGREEQGKSSGRTIKIIIILKPNIQNEERLERRRVRRENDTHTTRTTDLFLLPILLLLVRHPVLLLFPHVFQGKPSSQLHGTLSLSPKSLFYTCFQRKSIGFLLDSLAYYTHCFENFISVSYNSSLVISSFSLCFSVYLLLTPFSLPSLSSPKKKIPTETVREWHKSRIIVDCFEPTYFTDCSIRLTTYVRFPWVKLYFFILFFCL